MTFPHKTAGRKSPLTVIFNTWATAFDCPGGGEVQLLKYEECLTELGVRVLRYDMWNPRPQFDAADIVHFFSVQPGSWRFLAHVRDSRKIPLVISPIVWFDKPQNYCLDEIAHMLRMADHILPNSKAECEQLEKSFNIGAERFTPIVNGAAEIFFTPASPRLFRQTFNLREPFVLCMGNVEARKNQLRLIEALSQTGVHLVLAGQDREAEYAAQCRAHAGDNVHFVGVLEHGSELQRSAYAAAEVLCLPSMLETPGLAALEAAAAGARLALTKVGCTEEYFGKYAVYADPEDVESIRTAVFAAMKNPRSPELQALVREKYTWKHAAQELIGVYERVVPA